jgi:hypothetical protein
MASTSRHDRPAGPARFFSAGEVCPVLLLARTLATAGGDTVNLGATALVVAQCLEMRGLRFRSRAAHGDYAGCGQMLV